MSTKIAIVSSSTPPNLTGGISSAHWNLYLALKNAGYDVKVFTYNDNGRNGEVQGDVIRHGAPYLWLRFIKILNRFFFAFLHFFVNSKETSYQLAYVLVSMIGARRINRSLTAFCPNILIIPDNGSPGFFISAPKGCKTIFISHHNYLRFQKNPLIGHFSSIDAKLAMYFEHRTVARVDTVICPSNYMKEIFSQTHNYSGNVEVIPNIVDQELIASIPHVDMHHLLDISNEAPIIYIPSAGTSFKGSRYVFEIIRRLSTASKQIGFYITGNVTDDILRSELEYLPNNVRLYSPGQVSYEQNISMIKGCTLCVSPTVLESFGMAILEANFCGVPVVAFNVGGNADIIKDDVNGYLVPFLDLEKLIDYSRMLLNKDVNEQMKSSTLQFVNTAFATENILDRYINLIEQYA